MNRITVQTLVDAPLQQVWEAWTTPADIEQWNSASPEWHTPRAEVDLREGGRFWSRMEARDGSAGFDFTGTYVRVEPLRLIEYVMEDGRKVAIAFDGPAEGPVTVRETFDAEGTHTPEQQRAGWQAILDNFKRHVEGGAAEAVS